MAYIALKNYLYLPEQVQKNKADINTLRNAFQLEYSDTTEYFKPQIVSVDGVAYIALQDTPFKGHYPPTSPDFWAVFASGPEGPQGPAGKDGIQGETGPQGPKGDTGAEGNGIYFYFKPIWSDTVTVDLDYIALPVGKTIQNGDILFSTNDASFGNIGWILKVNDEFRLAYAGALRGRQGPVGPQGYTGDVGPRGPQGIQGKEGFSIYLINAYIDAETEYVPLADILKPAGRTVQPYDILLSSYADTQGAYAYVTEINGNVAKINYVGTTLQGPQGVSVTGATIREI